MTTLPLNYVVLDYIDSPNNRGFLIFPRKKKIGMSIKTQKFSIRINPMWPIFEIFNLPLIIISLSYYSKNIPGISGFRGSVI